LMDASGALDDVAAGQKVGGLAIAEFHPSAVLRKNLGDFLKHDGAVNQIEGVREIDLEEGFFRVVFQ
jgi:hypothetical protein